MAPLCVAYGLPPRRDVERHAERTGDDVGLRVGQRVAIGMEDVGLEERRRVRGEGVGDPGDVPHAPFAVAEVEAGGAVELARHRPGHGDGEERAPAPGGRSMSRRVRTAWGRMVACRPMRLLVPLITAAALAIAGWLASGIVTVRVPRRRRRASACCRRSARSSSALPAAAARAGVACGCARDAGCVGGSVAARGRCCMLAPVVLPWLPLPLPAALLVWTGRWRSAGGSRAVAYVYADAFGDAGRARCAARRVRRRPTPCGAASLAALVDGRRCSPRRPGTRRRSTRRATSPTT